MNIFLKSILRVIVLICVSYILVIAWSVYSVYKYSTAIPEDYNRVLISNIVDITKKDARATHEVTFIYEDTYNVEVVYNRLKDDKGKYTTDAWKQKSALRLEMSCKYSDNQKKTFRLGNNYSPFEGDVYWGHTLISFKVPQDLPVNKTLLCEFGVLEPEKKLTRKFDLIDVQLKLWHHL